MAGLQLALAPPPPSRLQCRPPQAALTSSRLCKSASREASLLTLYVVDEGQPNPGTCRTKTTAASHRCRTERETNVGRSDPALSHSLRHTAFNQSINVKQTRAIGFFWGGFCRLRPCRQPGRRFWLLLRRGWANREGASRLQESKAGRLGSSLRITVQRQNVTRQHDQNTWPGSRV